VKRPGPTSLPSSLPSIQLYANRPRAASADATLTQRFAASPRTRRYSVR
jgi:hypothetical protein